MVVALLATATVAVAQLQRGSITGVVTDEQGAAILGADITVTDEATGAVYRAKTDQVGSYTVPSLPFGRYTVTVEFPGFKRWVATGISVVTAQAAIVNPRLEVGDVEETVTVEAGQEVINTVSAELTTTINRRQILDLPTLTRSPLDILVALPGVQESAGTRTAVFGGLRGATNNLTQDGINIQDNFIRNDGLFAMSVPTVENTGEFSVSSQNIGADAGAGVAQVRITTPRGSNEFHGGLFYFHRNDAFNANNWINNSAGRRPDGTPVSPKARLRQHRFGGSVGGPVSVPGLYDGRERSFFFFRYEGFRQNFQVIRNRTVLTQTARQGLFTYVGTDGVQRTVNLFDPSVNTQGRVPNAFMNTLISATPLPNNTLVGDGLVTQGFRFPVSGSNPDNRYTLRIDHKLVEGRGWGTHWVEWVYNWNKFTTFPDTFNANEAAFPPGIAVSCVEAVCLGAGQSSDRNVMAAAIHSSFGPTIFNEFRVGYQRAPVGFLREAPFPRSFRVTYPLVSLMENNFLDQGRITPVYQFIENFTKVWRSHTFRAGFSATSVSGRTFNDAGTIPLLTLGNNAFNTHGLPDSAFPASNVTIRTRAQSQFILLTGQLGSNAQTFYAHPDDGFLPGLTNAIFIRERSYNMYFADTWRVAPKLTLTMGLRYELIPAPDLVNRRALQPANGWDDLFIGHRRLFVQDPSVTFSQFLLVGGTRALDNQLVLAGKSNGRPFWDTDKNNFAPSLGIAWQFLPRTVIRTGYAISYTRDGMTVVTQPLGSNTGLTTSVTNNTITGVLNPNTTYTVPSPVWSLPLSQVNNFIITQSSTGLFTFDPKMRTPYVQQWSFGIERELTPTMGFAVRYVGNHAVRLRRGIDVAQVDIFSNGMLQEFLRAQSNLACNIASGSGNTFRHIPANACSQPLPILEAMNFPTSFYTSATWITPLQQDAVGQWVFVTHLNCTFQFLASNGTVCAGLGNFPANFFNSNPLGQFMDYIGNHSRSRYDSLQAEFNRRFSRGLLFQTNYTYGKILTDSVGAAQNTFDPNLDIRNPRFDRSRADFDIRHAFNSNFVWEIPVGKGRRYLAQTPFLNKVLEGWQVGGFYRWRTGRPLSINSNRGTLNRAARSDGKNPAVILGGRTASEVCNAVGVYRTSNGLFWLPDEYLNRVPNSATTSGANLAVLTNPAPGQVGNHSLYFGCNSPSFSTTTINLIKRTSITERVNFEFRAEFFNLFNNPTFVVPQNNNINSAGFGTITAANAPREIQFNFRINF